MYIPNCFTAALRGPQSEQLTSQTTEGSLTRAMMAIEQRIAYHLLEKVDDAFRARDEYI